MKREEKKTGRNDPCPCGSGLKYKKCCMNQKTEPDDFIRTQYRKKFNIRLKGKEDILGIKKAGQLVVETLDLVESKIRPGMLTEEIDRIVHRFTLENGATPATLNYRGYPKSVCVSVNEVICHGIPGDRELEDGDIVNVDVTSILNGYYADANKTFFVGEPKEDAKHLVEVTRTCLKKGIEAVKPGNTIGDIGYAIQSHAESHGCSVVREFVGHGVGFEFHEAPQVPHYGRIREGVTLVPGMVFTIEPMINLGGRDLVVLEDKWTAVTRDGSLSAQFEQTVLVTGSGVESLTPFAL